MTQAWDFVNARILWQQNSKILNQRIDESGLSVRTVNALCHCRMGLDNDHNWVPDPINTVGELVRFTDHALLREPNFGHKSLKEIKEFLSFHGLRLGMTP